jgi:hypothetical protein
VSSTIHEELHEERKCCSSAFDGCPLCLESSLRRAKAHSLQLSPADTVLLDGPRGIDCVLFAIERLWPPIPAVTAKWHRMFGVLMAVVLADIQWLQN